MAKTHPQKQSQGLNLRLICFVLCSLHQPNLSSLRLSSLLLVLYSVLLPPPPYSSQLLCQFGLQQRKRQHVVVPHSPLGVVMAGSLVSICTLICHSANAVKKDSISKWKTLHQQLKGK